jgi:uncharacterized protein YjiS (DUF1127 family)
MTTIDSILQPRTDPFSTIRRLRAFLSAWLSAHRRRKEAQRGFEILRNLDKKTLDDIGVTRAEISNAARRASAARRSELGVSLFYNV